MTCPFRESGSGSGWRMGAERGRDDRKQEWRGRSRSMLDEVMRVGGWDGMGWVMWMND